MSFLQKYIQNDGGVIRIINGIENGRPAWFFIKLSFDVYDKYKKHIGSGRLNVGDYGEILKCGWGDYPPENIINSIKKQYA